MASGSKKYLFIIIILSLLLVFSNIYQFLNKSQIIEVYKSKIDEITEEKLQLQAEFIASSSQVDSLNSVTKNLEDKLSKNNSEITKLKAEISKILKKENLTQTDLENAKNLIIQLNLQVKDMSNEITKLKEENQQLTEINQELNNNLTIATEEKKKIKDSLSFAESQKSIIEDIASTMIATFFKLTVVKENKSGKQKITNSAKKANLIKVDFILADNKIANSGQKNIYVIITDPDGKVLSESLDNKFTTREEGDKIYSDNITVTFTKGQTTPVSYVKKISKARKGIYKLEVYQNGFKIGEDVKELK